MVANIVIHKVEKVLEKYLLQKNDFVLKGYDFDLILLKHINSAYLEKYAWIVSSKHLDHIEREVFILDIFVLLKEILPFKEYSSVYSINKLKSTDQTVAKVNEALPFKGDYIDVNQLTVGSLEVEKGILIRSKVLPNLKERSAVTLILTSGVRMNAGIISMSPDFVIKYYTGKGLREMFPQEPDQTAMQHAKYLEMQNDDFLVAQGYLDFVPFDTIEEII